MSNSPLVTYRHITSHKDKGRVSIQKIFVHHMAGNLTVKQCGSVFDSRQASAHYGINGTDIGQYVDESDTAWHCGNWYWNQRSIGIELANDGGANWHVSNSTVQTAIKLIADICRRNGIEELRYTGDMSGNLCMHKWVCSTSCPGPYLSTQFEYIADRVNEELGMLEIDGIGGKMTVTRLQNFLGVKQYGVFTVTEKNHKKACPGFIAVEYGDKPSPTVEALQRWLGFTTCDGKWGPITSTLLQQKIGIKKCDGIFGEISVKYLQRYLNSHNKAEYPKSKYYSKTTTIGHACANEYGSLYGGKPGDQTGHEVQLSPWSQGYGWKYVFRHKDPAIRLKIAQYAIDACENKHIGYNASQPNRYAAWDNAEKNGHNIRGINTNGDTTCTQLVSMVLRAVGTPTKYAPRHCDVAVATSVMPKNPDLMVLGGREYVGSPNMLLPGDMLLSSHHMAIVVKSPNAK